MAATIYIDKLGEQEITRERGLIREVVTVRDITDWWDSTNDGGPVPLGETASRLYGNEDFPLPGARLVDAGGNDVMPNRPLYLIDINFTLKDLNKAQAELRFEYLGSKNDNWNSIDGSLQQIQTAFDNQDPPQPITLSHLNANGTPSPQGAEVSVQDPRRRAVKTYGRFLQPGETASSLVGQYLGKVNATAYLSEAAGKWLVKNMMVETRVENFGVQQPLVQITVELEFNPRGHQQFVYWRDPLTGLPGINLVSDEGYKRVDWHDEIEFDVEFGP